MSVKELTLEQFHQALRAQQVERQHLALKCPMCDTVQSAASLINAGAGKTFDDVDGYLGFSCVGRFLGAPSPRKKPDGKPCNWTLGGFLQTHTVCVVTPDGERHARFEPATQQEAQILRELNSGFDAQGPGQS